jgi:hypothetical protein
MQRNLKITQLKDWGLLGYDALSLGWWLAKFLEENDAFETSGIIHPTIASYPRRPKYLETLHWEIQIPQTIPNLT